MYAIATGPYGVLMALCWDRGAHGSPSSLVLLGAEPGQSQPPKNLVHSLLDPALPASRAGQKAHRLTPALVSPCKILLAVLCPEP